MSIRDELAGLMYEAGLADDPDSDDLTAAAGAILARFGVVELPLSELSEDDLDEGDDPREWRAPWATYFISGGRVESADGVRWSPENARMLAAALLAAAKCAEDQL